MNVASFFTGIGGFDIAFERLGMTVVFQCEINKFCHNVLRHHWPHIEITTDIQEVKTEQIQTSDFWCGGFPCQDVSLANQGKRLGLEGNRSGLFHQVADLIEERQMLDRPKWLLLENVPGLLNSHEGNDFRTVVRRLSNLGYNIAWRVLDAKYFGTAQRRRRVFIVCSLGNFKSINVLFESGLTITEKQGLGVRDIQGRDVPREARDYYVIQHASIGRKPSAGPQAKGYRNDGETYTFDSRGSADVIVKTTMPFRIEVPNVNHITSAVSNRYRTIGNAVNVNVVQSIGENILRAHEADFDRNLFNQTQDEFLNATIPTQLNDMDNIKRWHNAGMVINGECLMLNTLEHFKEPHIEHLNEFILDRAPLDHFLNSTQLQSILDRAEHRIQRNPNSEHLPDDFRTVIIRQRDALLRNEEFDSILKDKKKQKEINYTGFHISDDILNNLYVRRMTALEYERMQGFPDHWTTWEPEQMTGMPNHHWITV